MRLAYICSESQKQGEDGGRRGQRLCIYSGDKALKEMFGGRGWVRGCRTRATVEGGFLNI